MKKSAIIHARVEPELKKQIESLFANLGLSMTDAIGLFFRRALQKNGLPFEVSLKPNQETQNAIDELETGKGEVFENVEAMFEDLGI